MNMKIHLLSGAVAWALAQGAVAQQAPSQKESPQTSTPPAAAAASAPDKQSTSASSSDAEYNRSMERLTKAAQNLRAAVQAMAAQPPGQGRNAAMKQANDALLETQQAMVQLPPELRKAARDAGANQADKSASSTAGQKNTGSSAADSTITANVPVVVMVPVKMNLQEESQGCWAKLYDQQKYQGDNMMLVGPVDLPRMRGPMGMSWENKVESVETGPKAQVVIYDNENFRDRNKVLNPGSKVPELDEKLGFFENVRSLKVSCS
jgi:Beta/Gamma crystallin